MIDFIIPATKKTHGKQCSKETQNALKTSSHTYLKSGKLYLFQKLTVPCRVI